MKTLCFILMSIAFLNAQSQSTYIQINGEAGLSVYLNNVYKGKTTADLNGIVIDKVTPGSNLIKVVKEGYTPYEETITVKKGEVFEYKVKPFEKRSVTITETGNSGESEKKAQVPAGVLVVQSVPIQVKITMPAIEGVENLQKNKDKWTVDNLAEGTYTITFRYNNKEIKKDVKILGENTTTVFVNMLTGEFSEKNTNDETIARKEALDKAQAFAERLCKQYKFKAGLTRAQFQQYNPEAVFLFSHKYRNSMSYYNPKIAVGPAYASTYQYDRDWVDEIDSYKYNILVAKDKAEVENKWKEMVQWFKDNVDENHLLATTRAAGAICELIQPGSGFDIRLGWEYEKNMYACYIEFSTYRLISRRRNNN